MHVMEESSTDQRLRAMAKRFDRLESSISDFRTEVRDSIAELRGEIQATNAALGALQRTLIQVGGGLIGTMIVVIGATQF